MFKFTDFCGNALKNVFWELGCKLVPSCRYDYWSFFNILFTQIMPALLEKKKVIYCMGIYNRIGWEILSAEFH